MTGTPTARPPAASAAARTAASRTCSRSSPSPTDASTPTPHADRVEQGVLVYEAGRCAASSPTPRRPTSCGPSWPTPSPRARASSSSPAPSTPRSSTGSPPSSSASSPTRRPRGRAAGDHFAEARRQRPGLERPGEGSRSPTPTAFVDYYANDLLALAATRLARPRLPGHQPGQRRQPGRRRPDRAPRLPPGLPVARGHRPLPGPRPRRVAAAHAPGRRRPLRHAGRVGPDAVPAAQPEVLARLPRVLARRSSRSTSSGHHVQLPLRQGRRGLLQPRALPRGRLQPHGRRAPHGEPAAGLVGFRPGHGDRRPATRRRARCTRSLLAAAGHAGMPAARVADAVAARRGGLRVPDQPRPRPPRSTGWPRPPRPTIVRAALAARLTPEQLGSRLDAVALAKRSH